MKKKYKKPIVIFENMQLNTSIAACKLEEVSGGGLLSTDYPGIILFELGDNNSICDMSGNEADIYCYHSPQDTILSILNNLS